MRSVFQVIDNLTEKVYFTAPMHGYCSQWLLDNFPDDEYTINRSRLRINPHSALSKNMKSLPHVFRIREVITEE